MVSLHPETTEKHVLFWVGTVCDLHQHAASVSWRLSSGRWNVTAWYFVQQSCSSFWFSQGYCPEAAETLSCLVHCMWLPTFSSSACNVKGTRCLYQGQTRAQPLPNCLCDILKNSWVMCNQYQNWSQPYAGSTPFATVDPVCRPTCHVAGESPWITVIHCYSLMKVVFTWAEVLNMCGMRWSADFVICISSLLKPIGNSLLKILCRPGMSSFKTFTHVPLAPCCEYAQQWSMQEEDTWDTDSVTSIPTSQFSATSQNTKYDFCKFQVWLTIWKITRAFIDNLFQWAICHGWKNIPFFTMHSFFCWRVYSYLAGIS